MRFECLAGCGLCCSYKVTLQPGEIEKIESLGYTPGYFVRDGSLRKDEGFCVFLGDDRRCAVYDQRPAFCRSYPFYREDDGSTDVDLSCPGVGRGPEVEPAFEYSAPGICDMTVAEKLPGFLTFERFRQTGIEWCSKPVSQLPARDFGNLFNIPNGMNTHISGGGIVTYSFDFRGDRLVIGGGTHVLSDEDMPAEYPAEVTDYLRTWFGRYVFYRFCLACSMSAPVLLRPTDVAFQFMESLARRISEVRAALACHWEQDDIEILREAIRGVDGRLRTKCRAARIQIGEMNLV